MITLLFCLRQHFSVMTSLIFIQNLAITVSSVTTEPFIISESITTCLKAIELFFQNTNKLVRHFERTTQYLVF